MQTKLLTKMVDQFRDRHGGEAPKKIIVEPMALVALGIKRSIAPVWNGIPVECQELRQLLPTDVVESGQGTRLMIAVDPEMNELVAAELS